MTQRFIFSTGLDLEAQQMVAACAKALEVEAYVDDDLYLDYPEVMMDPQAYKSKLIEAIALVGFVNENSSPSCLYEMGIAIGANRPTILLTHSNSGPYIGFIDAPVFVFQDAEDPATQIRLLELLRAEIDRVAEGLERVKSTERPSVFISYSHQDATFLARLMTHLRPLERSGDIDAWADTRIRPGDDWKSSIDDALQAAKVAILLISADFLSSEFIVNDELPTILHRAEEHGTLILPVVLSPCRFLREPVLRKFQCVHDPSRPIGTLTSIEQEAVYDKVAQEVERWLARA